MMVTGYASLVMAIDKKDEEGINKHFTQSRNFIKKYLPKEAYEAAYNLIEEAKRKNERDEDD